MPNPFPFSLVKPDQNRPRASASVSASRTGRVRARNIAAELVVNAAPDGYTGALPAISAPLIAPIEMPATQSGCSSASANAV
jgi:hypothetical protein